MCLLRCREPSGICDTSRAAYFETVVIGALERTIVVLTQASAAQYIQDRP